MGVRPLLTAIGSWPEGSIEQALDWAFELDLPALPELPKLGPHEDMIGTFLSGAPAARSAFLDRVDRLRPGRAKMQCIGPVTLFELKRRGEPRLRALSESEMLARLRARLLSDAEALRQRGTTAVIFLDEPLLLAPSAEHRRLSALIDELHRASARVGLHCCGPLAWPELLALGFDQVAIDANEPSWPKPTASDLSRFRSRGGRLMLGAVSQAKTAPVARLVSDYGPDVDLSFSCGLAGAPAAEVPALIERLRSLREDWARLAGSPAHQA
jgi:hypothetical protein